MPVGRYFAFVGRDESSFITGPFIAFHVLQPICQSLSQMAFRDSAKKSNFSLGHLWSRIMNFLWVYYTVLFTCKRTSPTWKSQNCWRNPRFCPPPTLPGPPLPSILIQTDAASPDHCRCCSRTALHTLHAKIARSRSRSLLLFSSDWLPRFN